ncbi:acyl-CoA desaturase [Patulibacter brassicae]|uniref:Acyl-CoA desaturase n=1 Tax=Patulibacter brassicae TaxID=1705717 RepID=A0ABU4VGV4_9ACTN|nr:acyl-CoA desaturase [Patulibacter brassicae]MDX8151057.1 acyl-CoA desaturase [Patulibacter brassicae]
MSTTAAPNDHEPRFVPALDPDTPLSPSAPDGEADTTAGSHLPPREERRRIDPSRRVANPPLRAVPHLSQEDLDAFGREMEAIRDKHVRDLGQQDADYIRGIIRAQRRLEIGGRAALELSFLPPLWLAGVAALSASKILDNMEIGHNVMHGQYDWMQDEELNGRTFEWDTACPADQWRHSHNYMHHTHTNIVGKDRDVGYGILRMSEDQEWEPYFLGNPVYATLLALLFEYGVALHDLETEDLRDGSWDLKARIPMLQAIWGKVRRQAAKDYLLFPALAGPFFPLVLAGNASANLVRNLWTFSIIFCGHFPDGVEEFTVEETANETRGGWYVRQLLGSSNLDGGRLFHVMSGNLSFQIEHHLFPDIPAWRYAQMSEDVREACERYGLQYNSGPLPTQLWSVARKIARLAVPTEEEADAYLASDRASAIGRFVVSALRAAGRGAGQLAAAVR